MEMLDLGRSGIGESGKMDDDGAAMLLGCLSNVKRLKLWSYGISFEMQTKLYERGRKEGCEVNCDLT